MLKSGISVKNIDMQFCELYYEVFWYEQVKFHYISFACLVYVHMSRWNTVKNIAAGIGK